MRFQRLLVAVQADVSDLRVGEEVGQPLHHAEPRAQDGDDRDLFVHDGRIEVGDGRLNVHHLCLDVSERLISHQHSEFGYDLAEFLGLGIDVAQVRDFVRDERVIEYGYVFHEFFHK